MLFDVVHGVLAVVEAGVSSRLGRAEGEVECLKRGLKGLTLDVRDNFNKPLIHTLRSAQDSTVSGYANTLKQWTGKTTARVVYDSTACPFTGGCLFQMVKDKPNIAIVATTADGDVFGGFYNVSLTKQEKDFGDLNMFVFSFESHGRCMTPQRFAVKRELRGDASVRFNKNNKSGWFVKFDGGDGWFYLGNEKSETYCVYLSRGFEGIEDTTLTGKNDEFFTCCRLVAIQIE